MQTFLEDNIKTSKFFIESGLLEAVHLHQKEREIVVKGMEEMMTKCVQEINQSMLKFAEKTNKPSIALLQ